MRTALPVSRILTSLGLALTGLTSAPAHSQEGEKLPLWEAGVFAAGLSQQAYPGSSQQIDRAIVLPFFVYRGKYFRADQNTVGLRAVKTDAMELDIGFGGALGSSSKDVDVRKGMPDLGTLVEFGPRLKWNLGAAPGGGRLRAEVALRGVFDVSDSFRDKGVALLIIKRQVQRVIHVSTGAGGKTPVGNWNVYRKERNSWSRAFSVNLPYASYFRGGYAFHQYPSVPAYPASHGCIRVGYPEAPAVYEFAAQNTPVIVL